MCSWRLTLLDALKSQCGHWNWNSWIDLISLWWRSRSLIVALTSISRFYEQLRYQNRTLQKYQIGVFIIALLRNLQFEEVQWYGMGKTVPATVEMQTLGLFLCSVAGLRRRMSWSSSLEPELHLRSSVNHSWLGRGMRHCCCIWRGRQRSEYLVRILIMKVVMWLNKHSLSCCKKSVWYKAIILCRHKLLHQIYQMSWHDQS